MAEWLDLDGWSLVADERLARQREREVEGTGAGWAFGVWGLILSYLFICLLWGVLFLALVLGPG